MRNLPALLAPCLLAFGCLGRFGTGALAQEPGAPMPDGAPVRAEASAPAPGPGAEITVEEAVRLGLERNRRVRAARADAEGARAAFRQVRASRLPTVRVTGDLRRLLGDVPEAEFTVPGLDTTFSILPIPRDQVYTEVSVEQPLFQGMRLLNQERAAEHEARAATLRADQEEADVALEVRRAYWTLFRALADRQTAEAALARVEAHVREVGDRYDEGVLLRSDLLAARTRRSEVRLQQIEADNAVRVARLELSRLVGLPLDSEVRPSPGPGSPAAAVDAAAGDAPTDPAGDRPPDPAVGDAPADTAGQPAAGAEEPGQDLESLRARALDERPQLRALSEEIRALERRVGVSRGAWLPEISMVGRYIYARPNPLVYAETDAYRGIGEAGVVLRWNLFEGGRRPAETAEARAALEAAEERLADSREAVEVEVARRSLDVIRTREALAVAAEHAEEAAESFRVVSDQFDEGAALSSQVLEAEEVQRAAESRRANAVAEHAVARASLLNALGRIW